MFTCWKGLDEYWGTIELEVEVKHMDQILTNFILKFGHII